MWFNDVVDDYYHRDDDEADYSGTKYFRQFQIKVKACCFCWFFFQF